LKSPKIRKLNIDTLIIPQGLLIHEKKQTKKSHATVPLKEVAVIFENVDEFFEKIWTIVKKYSKSGFNSDSSKTKNKYFPSVPFTGHSVVCVL